jgi:hypothetical protein
VLGEALGLSGFSYENVESVRAQVLGAAGSLDSSRLDNGLAVDELSSRKAEGFAASGGYPDSFC